MLYPFMTLNDNTEIVHSEILENSGKEETNNTVEDQSINEELQEDDTLSPKTGENQMGKIMAAMVIVGCLAVIYIVRKRELYEK